MTSSNESNVDDRLNQLEQDFREFREEGGRRIDRLEYLVTELSGIAQLHQQGFRVFQTEMQNFQIEMREMRTDIRGLQTTANRTLERLEQHMSDGHGG